MVRMCLHGPAFCDKQGNVALASHYETDILDRLESVQAPCPSILAPDLTMHESYGISRSLHRGAMSEARARGISPSDIDLINRWCTFKNAKGRRPRQNMRDHYSDIPLLIPALVHFSQAL